MSTSFVYIVSNLALNSFDYRIPLRDQNLLWLPAEYCSSACHAVKDAIKDLGYSNGGACNIVKRKQL